MLKRKEADDSHKFTLEDAASAKAYMFEKYGETSLANVVFCGLCIKEGHRCTDTDQCYMYHRQRHLCFAFRDLHEGVERHRVVNKDSVCLNAKDWFRAMVALDDDSNRLESYLDALRDDPARHQTWLENNKLRPICSRCMSVGHTDSEGKCQRVDEIRLIFAKLGMAIVKEVEDNSRYHLSTKFVGVAFDHYDQGSSRKRVRLSEEEKEKKAANANVSVNANLNVDANVNVNENETENEGLEKKDEENQREEGLRTEKETRGKPAGEGNASERSDTQSVP